MSATVFTSQSSPVDEPGLAVAAGRNLILAGAVFGSANLFQYGVTSGALPISPAFLSLSWPVALTVFFIVLNRLRCAGGRYVQRAAGWSRAAILLQVAIALGLLALSIVRHDFTLMYWTSPVGLTVYSAAWATAGLRGGKAWMAVPSAGALCAAGLVITLLGTPPAYLAYAVALFAFVLIPGLWLVVGPRVQA